MLIGHIKKFTNSWEKITVINFAVLILLIKIMRPTFETNDDLAIMEFVSGAITKTDAHLVYQNYILGNIYILLYTLTKSIPWYGLLQYVFLLIAFSALTYVIWERVRGVAGFTVSAIILCFFSYEAYIQMQYTKTAGILSIVGIVLIFYATTKKKVSWVSFGVGMMLACVGSMYRLEQFFPCAVLMSGIGLYEVLNASEEKNIKKVLLPLISMAVLFILIIGLKMYDNSKYSQNSVWQQYKEYNELRTELLDYEFPKYKDYEEQYQSLGITEDAYWLWDHWNFGDPELFTNETMRNLLALNEKKAFDKDVILDFIDKVPDKILKSYAFYVLLIMLLFWVLQGNFEKKQIIVVSYELMLLSVMYIYLFWQGRYLKNRVDVCLSLAVISCLIWLMNDKKVWLTKRSGILAVGIVLIFLQSQWIDHSWKNTKKIVEQEKNNIQELSKDKEHLYIAKNKTVSYAKGFGPLSLMPEGISSNFTFFGGWETNTVLWKYKLEYYQAENLYKDSVNNDQVRIIDDEIDITMNYIHTYYDENAEAEQMGEYEGYPVYRIISANRG